MVFLSTAFNRRCQVFRRLVSRLLRKNIPLYPNRATQSCKTIISPFPVVPYRRLLILHRGRRAAEDLYPQSQRHTKYYICTNNPRHSSSSDCILTYVCQCSGPSYACSSSFLHYLLSPSSPSAISIFNLSFCLFGA